MIQGRIRSQFTISRELRFGFIQGATRITHKYIKMCENFLSKTSLGEKKRGSTMSGSNAEEEKIGLTSIIRNSKESWEMNLEIRPEEETVRMMSSTYRRR